jgi:hypothetical protein
VANSEPQHDSGLIESRQRHIRYARMNFEQRIAYFDKQIAELERQDKAWREEYAKAHGENPSDKFRSSQFVVGPFSETIRELITARKIGIEDREPLDTTQINPFTVPLSRVPMTVEQIYRRHMDSARWKRTRSRKLASVEWRCEYPGCAAQATDCHHRHYNNVGLETNADLEALCRGHHEVRHWHWRVVWDSDTGWPQPPRY